MLLLADKWKDYELIDMGNGEKLERWGDVVLRRPDPQVMWPIKNESGLWKNPHGHYHRSAKGGGHWETKKKYPQKWTVNYKGLKFNISPTGFKHTGLFPEQAANWDWQMDMIKKANRPIKVLNLFAYTGGATVACAAAGAEVCHVDASKGMVTWAKENLQTSGLGDRNSLEGVGVNGGLGGLEDCFVVLIGAGEGDFLGAGFALLNVQTQDACLCHLDSASYHGFSCHLLYLLVLHCLLIWMGQAGTAPAVADFRGP